MTKRTLLLVGLLVAVALAGCGSGAPKVDWELRIEGAAGNPMVVTYADLAKMEQVNLDDIMMEKSTGEDVTTSWSGVPVAALLAEAGIPVEYASITATAADGYAIEISRDEMQDAIIALKDNGEWIATADPDHGPIRLVCPHTPANRWVFQLQALQANP